MAKSTRSKVKRAYRAKKREAGVYAAAEAARLNRLNAKLAQIIAGSEEDMPLDNSGGDDDIPPGLFSFPVFGLLDSNNITSEVMHSFAKVARCNHHIRTTQQ